MYARLGYVAAAQSLQYAVIGERTEGVANLLDKVGIALIQFLCCSTRPSEDQLRRSALGTRCREVSFVAFFFARTF